MNQSIKTAYSDLLVFLKNPVDQAHPNQSIKGKASMLGLIVMLDIVLAFICSLLLIVLEILGIISMENHKMLELIEAMPKEALFLVVVVFVPFVEELIFRLYLRYKANILLRFLLLFFYVGGKGNKERIGNRVKQIWNKQYAFIFYFSALLFGFIHIFNFDVNTTLFILFPLVTSAQIITGILAGYLRVRYNLMMGYFLHALHNMILFLPFFFMSMDLTK